ncbi:hypothetical protein L9F63_002418, partial [Diploptera punctata]
MPLTCIGLLMLSTGVISLSNVAERHKQPKFTIDELLTTRFPNRISDDIDVDPCKADAIGGQVKRMARMYEKSGKNIEISAELCNLPSLNPVFHVQGRRKYTDDSESLLWPTAHARTVDNVIVLIINVT